MKTKKILLVAAFSSLALGLHYLNQELSEKASDGVFTGTVISEEDGIKGVYAKPFVVPSDSNYSTQKQYSMNNIGDIEKVWDTYTGKDVTIAVIDDGFAPLHPEYKRKDGTSAILESSRYYYVDSAYNKVYYKEYKTDKTCLNEDYDSSSRSLATHGTNTSTTAAAPINNVGGVGVAPDADLLLLKIDMSFAAIEEAIKYAVEAGADVINMSLGAYSESFYDGFNTRQSGSSSVATYLNDVCDAAYQKGVIVVAAAGNEATYHKSYPASNNHVIGVGALSKNSSTELAYYTNYNSKGVTGEKNVDILAPGSVYTASVSVYTSSSSNWTYNYTATQGTSFASPIVAGSAALWLEKNQNTYSGSALVDAFTNELTTSAANIGKFTNKYVDASAYGYSKYLSNLECGTLDVGSLLKIDEEQVKEEVKVQSVSINEGDLALKIDETKSVSATITPSNSTNKNVTWSVSDESIVKITSQSGLTVSLKGLKKGETTLSVVTKDGSHSASIKITVSEEEKQEVAPDQTLKGSITFESTSSYYDSYYSLSNTGAASSAKSDESLGDVKIGNVSSIYQAKSGYGWKLGSFYYGGSFDLSFASTLVNPTITVIAAAYPYDTSTSLTLNEVTLDISGSSFKEYVFALDSLDLLSIKSSGRVYLKSLTISEASSSKEPDAKEPVETHRELTLDKETLTLKVGEEGKLIATYKTNDGGSTELNWFSTNSSVASVNENGVVTALKEGETTVYVYNYDGSVYASCKVRVEAKQIESETLEGTIRFTSTSDSYFDDFDYLTANTALSNSVIDETLGSVTFSSLNKVVKGKAGYGWKFSSMLGKSSFSIAFAKTVKASKVVLELASYKYDSNVKFALNGVEATLSSSSFQKYEFTLGEFSKLTLTSSSGRSYIKSLQIVA